ncbi:MAG TPA: acetolactate synthase [Gemmatales bacterium]|nr:acetolactate synthase [Gemmatales bacterium]
MSFGGNSPTDYATARGRDWPSVRQFSVFLENRVGALMEMVRKFEASENRILALSVVDSADCSIVRIVLSDPERACETFHLAGLPYLESNLLVVRLPKSTQPLAQTCKSLLAAEINIHYAYPLLIGPQSQPALAVHVDDQDAAIASLHKQGLEIFTENELRGS